MPVKTKRKKQPPIALEQLDRHGNPPWAERFRTVLELQIIKLGDRIAETNERLRVIESDIEKLQKYVGVLSAKFPTLNPHPNGKPDSFTEADLNRIVCRTLGAI